MAGSESSPPHMPGNDPRPISRQSTVRGSASTSTASSNTHPGPRSRDGRSRFQSQWPGPGPALNTGRSLQQQEEWKNDWELNIHLNGVPDTATTLDVFNNFSQYGSIDDVYLVESPGGGRTGTAKIRFERPLPRACFWSTGSHNFTFAKEGQPQSVQVEIFRARPRTEKVQRPSELGMTEFPRYSVLVPEILHFGILSKEQEMMVMKSVEHQPRHNTPFRFTLDLKFRRFEVVFHAFIPDPRRKDPSIQAVDPVGQNERVSQFQFYIPLDHIDRISRVKLDENRWAIIIPSDSPSRFFRRARDLKATHNPMHQTWKQKDTWFRTTDITYNTDWYKDAPTSSKKTGHFIDIGNWTTYAVVFSKHANLSDMDTMYSALKSLNIEITEHDPKSFALVPPKLSTFWSLISTPETTSSSADLALLNNSSISQALPFDIKYQLEACCSRGVFNEHSITAEFVDRLASLSARRTRVRDRARDILEYIAELGKRVFDPETIWHDKRATSHFPGITLPDHCLWVRKVTVTPTTIYLSSPVPDMTNRVLRKYSAFIDRFLRVQFTDERHEGKIKPEVHGQTQHSVFNRVHRTLRNGIVVADRHYKFLAFSSSQFRDNGAYFFCEMEGLTCDDIRASMGDFSHIRIPAKYAARLGQCLSTTRDTIKALTIGMTVKDTQDIEANGHCFSDGVGRISPALAHDIAHSLGMVKDANVPSAFQFRLGGAKGVIAVWPQAKFNEVHIRPSQTKFSSPARSIEIVRGSRYAVATLNKQVIPLLTSLGVEEATLLQMGRKQLKCYQEAMDDSTKALELFKGHTDEHGMTTVIAQMIIDGFMDAREPFVLALLRLWRSWAVRLLREKARIVVHDSAFLLGIVDETHILKGWEDPSKSPVDGERLPQIFLQVPKKDDPSTFHVITGTCVVGRNPSLHPGDLRVVEAVDVPELRNLKNVVVFPAQGDRSIPSMCSGGDLDGDDYFVIWDEALIPTERNYPPMIDAAAKPQELDRDVTIQDIMSFYVTFMKNDSLGQIATSHVALADQLGPKNEKCLELAQLHSDAVDFVKNGQPARLADHLRPRRWPHFTGRQSQTYHSDRVLGLLYDMTQNVDFTARIDTPFDTRILHRYKLTEVMLQKSRGLKRKYDQAIRRIMNQFELGTEFEVFSTFALTKPRVGTEYKLQERLREAFLPIRDLFVKQCVDYVGSRDPEKLYPFAAANYRITWEEVELWKQLKGSYQVVAGRNVPMRSAEQPLISFPWLFDSELGKIATTSLPENRELESLPAPTSEDAESWALSNEGDEGAAMTGTGDVDEVKTEEGQAYTMVDKPPGPVEVEVELDLENSADKFAAILQFGE